MSGVDPNLAYILLAVMPVVSFLGALWITLHYKTRQK